MIEDHLVADAPVTGDRDLLVLSDDLPILTPARFTTKLRQSR